MNDLAEKALEGLDVARRQVRGHPMLSLAGTGFVVGALVVAAGGRASAARPDRPLTSWLGLQDVRSAAIGYAAGSIMLAGVLTLAVLWAAALWLVAAQAIPAARVWWVAAAWAVPFLAGPPLMDTSVYTYVAYGRLLHAGRDPYDVGPTALGDSPIVAAIDPARRGTPSAAGPLGTLLQHLAVSVGNNGLLATVLVWRAMSLLAVVFIARSAAELSQLARLSDHTGPTVTAASAVAACALNPLVLLYAVSTPHVEAIVAALVLTALVAAGQRRWWRALVLATLAGGVGLFALVAVAMIAAAHWFVRRRDPLWPVIVRDATVVAVTAGLTLLAQPVGRRLLDNVQGQFSSDRTPYSLAGGAEKGLSVVVRVASDDDLAAGGRLTAALACVCVVGYLLATVLRRPLEVSAGCALLWIALLAPVLHPWYLLPGLLVLLPTAAGQARIGLVGVSVAACLLAPQGFPDLPADVVTGVSLAVVGAVTGAALWDSRPAPPPQSSSG